MQENAGIVLFGTEHWSALGAIAGVAVGYVLLARTARQPNTPRAAALALACLLLSDKAAVFFIATGMGGWQGALPMHLCDWTGIAAIVALVWRRQLAYEMTYFWGLGGTLQALITPDLAYDFPDVRFFTFFISHGGVIVAIAFLTLGLRMRPWPASLVRILVWSNIYLAAAGALDFALGENYGYLCAKPSRASLLDHLGPWPLYILSLEGIALVSYAVYYAPFFVSDRIGGTRPALRSQESAGSEKG